MRLLRHLLSPVVTEQREGTQLDALPYVCVYVRSRGGNSLDRDVTLNSVMQLDADSVLADGLDRLGDLDGPLLEGGATGLPDCQRNIARSHGPEQTTVLADLDSHLDDQVLQLRAIAEVEPQRNKRAEPAEPLEPVHVRQPMNVLTFF